MENEVMYIKLDDIIPNRFQPREVFDEKALNELADSIRQHGVIEPIIVRPISNKFEIIAGERRYKASALAGLTKIPAIVRNMDDKESSLVAFIENEQRRDVSVIESARTSERMLKMNNMTQEELAKSIGISQSTLANRLRLLELPLEVQESLMHNEISERHARSLLSVKDEAKQIELLRKIKEKKMTVRELESEIKNMNNGYNDNINEDIGNNYISNNDYRLPMGMNDNNRNNNVNNYLNNNINSLPNDNTGEDAGGNSNFMNFLNNYDTSSLTSSNNSVGNNSLNEMNSNSSFMNYLNDYDNTNPLPVSDSNYNQPENNIPNNEYQSDSNFMNFLNNYDNTNPLPVESNNLNDYNNTQNDINNDKQNNNEFMKFLNNYGSNSSELSNNSLNSSELNSNIGNNIMKEQNKPISDYIDNYDIKNSQDNAFSNAINNIEHIDNIDDEVSNNNSNLMIKNVNPPITSSFNNYGTNSYVEDNPNYVDISKNVTMDSVDDIIDELKETIAKIKSQSKFKIDTDEINFDDIYQVTIKIDKRDF